jgi:hypothetical protein
VRGRLGGRHFLKLSTSDAPAARTLPWRHCLYPSHPQPPHPSLPQVLVAHNGPTGLGGRRFSPCGVDWTEPEADHGDPDLHVGCSFERVECLFVAGEGGARLRPHMV